ncbi:hypothetical protein [uncultured Ruminococcus sp.]|uniref:hypothetical protein n=1 Tax=uncultured Ruminococcus sp. TaxID=165186 RepID=UPI0025D4ED6B|nr:hypothetical protein [uncultured Ruminococcus sp.]
MPKYCSSCGTSNPDHVTNCVNCGAVLDNYNQVYPVNQGGYTQPYNQQYSQPYSQQYPQAYNAPYNPPTTMGGWFGWLLLCSFFPIIGQLIMLSSKDESARNFAKVQLLLALIGIIAFVVIVVVFGVSLSDIFNS